MLINKLRKAEAYDTSHIRIIRGLGNLLETSSDDDSTDLQSAEVLSPKSTDDVKYTLLDKIWSPQVEGEPRVISLGDLKFEVGQRVVAVLPLYLDAHREVKKLSIVIGEIVDIVSIPVGEEDVPRHLHAKHHKPLPNWAQRLTISDYKENLEDRCQTIVTAYKLKLDPLYRLTADEIKKLSITADSESRLPFKYDLQFEQSIELQHSNQAKLVGVTGKKTRKQVKMTFLHDIVTVQYRYVMGTEKACQKFTVKYKSKNPLRVSPKKSLEVVTPDDMQAIVSKFKLYSGAYVQYSDSLNISSATLNFIVVDHLILAPFDIRFVIRSNVTPKRILAISKLTTFDVRLAYPVTDYYCFHPLDRYIYSIVEPPSNDPQQLKAVTEIIEGLFQPFEVYVVKKSLCNPGDIQSVICEDNMGNVKIVKTLESSERGYSESFAGSSLSRLSSKPEFKGLKFSGISITTYVKGLSYPEDNPPTEHDGYTFFHSKDYYELNLDPHSETFLEFECTSSKHSIFRNPSPKDVILAVPFNCDREIYRDRVNLRWFYPTEEFRLLHLYVKSRGMNNIFRSPHGLITKKSTESKKDVSARIKYIRGMFKDSCLAIIDLLLFGLSRENPTLSSPFTKRFVSMFFPWASL
jgi:hypothetical protein